MAMVAVMNDDKGQPALVVSWPPMKAMRDPHVRIRVVQEHPVMAPGTTWEMWMLPGGQGRAGLDGPHHAPTPIRR